MEAILLVLILVLAQVGQALAIPTVVSFDGRSFILNGERKIFVAGSVHYPRAPRSEWPGILKSVKESGIDLIQTYVFWDIHEPRNDEWYFPSDPTSSYDLVGFIEEAAKQGLYVHLRVAGYVCAEWNFGGLPVWLKELNSTLRTYDETWLMELSQFVEKTVSVVKAANLLADAGGPIIMVQIENEYGNMESNYGQKGRQYVEWLSDYALKLDVGGAAWVMCQQGEGVGTAPAKEIVNACNGFYCDNWIAQHAKAFPNQPHMFTENWPGWFQNWGEPVPHRPAVDVAFSVARWFARGGSYMNYYMAFGGSTFGRSVGGPLIVTSYDYDVQVNEYGMRAEPKYSLLRQLHEAIHDNEDVLLSRLPPAGTALQGFQNCEAHVYKDSENGKCVAFWSNWDEKISCPFTMPDGETVEVPPWSVTISSGSDCSSVIFNTKTSADAIPSNTKAYTPVPGFELQLMYSVDEPVPSSAGARSKMPVLVADLPLEQLSITHDRTDYLWYSTSLPARAVEGEATLTFSSGTAGGGIFYIYINKQLVARVLGKAGVNPINSAGFSVKATETSQVSVRLTVPGGQSAALDILSISMGLQNYGPFLEKIQVGIVADISLDGVQLRNFTHSVGLAGEVALGAAPERSAHPCDGLCWHTLSFRTPASVKSDTHLALDLSSSMGKGAVWVNGNMLGRYWNITAHASTNQKQCYDCPSEDYTGSYNGDKCRSGCGEPSQRYYKLPTDWLQAAGSEIPNILVLFEEQAGTPLSVQLVEVSMMAV